MKFVLILFILKAVKTRRPFDSSINVSQDANEVNSGKYSGDFGHVYRPGYENVNMNGNTYGNIDDELRNLDRNNQKDVSDVKEFLQGSIHPSSYRKPPPRVFLSPRDELSYYKEMNRTLNKNENKLDQDAYIKTIIRPKPLDYSSILENNLANPFANRRTNGFKIRNSVKQPKRAMPKKMQNISDYFEENTFYVKSNTNSLKLNWTTCDEFAKKAVFHPDDIVNTHWLPFFMWSKRSVSRAIVHTFSYPTKKVVQQFKTTYDRHVHNVNWNRPKLLLKEWKQVLLIARDNKGMFYGIPKQELSANAIKKNITIPTITLRLKVHDPYLAMMYCDEPYAVIMAELGTQPNSEREATLEASTLQFKGSGRPIFRNIEEEKFFERIQRERKAEEESRKFIKIPKIVGDVDRAVKH